VKFDLNNAPAVERKSEPPKKKEKKDKPVEAVNEKAVSSVKDKAAQLVDGKPQKNEKKEKKEAAPKGEEAGKKKGAAAPKPAAAEDAGEPVPSMIDLRVGHIIDGKAFWLIFPPRLNIIKLKNIQMQMVYMLK
jgi:aminoacyl tRNA synthase complex-interacting multifunctional protein 1